MNIIDISKAQALKLAASFVGEQWTSLNEDDITVNILSGGYSGRLYTVEDVSTTCHSYSTKKFIVRLYAGKLIEKDDPMKAGKCESSEGIVFFTNGLLGLGPKLLGVFDGGRVEEFVPSHRLTEEDLIDNTLSLEMARKLARFHSLKLPVPKEKRDLLNISAILHDKFDKEKLIKLVQYSGWSHDDSSPYLDEDYHVKHAFLRSYESNVGGRLVLCHGDLNKNNILVRDQPDKFNEHIMLIDYELAATDYRGHDLGALVLGRMFEMNDNGVFKQVCEWPDDDYLRMIISEYLQETRKLNYFDFDADGIDSFEHVLIETEFFVMYGVQLYLGFFKRMSSNDFVLEMPPMVVKSMIDFIPIFNTMHASFKNHFLEKYGQRFTEK